MAAISGGCGVPSHSLGILQTSYSARCLDCSSTIRSGDRFYFCHQCGHTSCLTCASRGRTAYNAPNPMSLPRAQQQRPPPQISRGRQSPQRRAVGAAESSPSSAAGSSPSSRAGSPPSSSRRNVLEVTDSDVTDSDDDHGRYVLRPRRMVNVAQSSHASPLEMPLHEADVSADDGEDDKNQPVIVIACPGSTSHELQFLKKSPYHQSGCFGCNMCCKAGYRDLYHCETCQFDAHKACAEIDMQVKVFYHKHPLQLYHIVEEEVTCRFCRGESEGDIRPWVYKCLKCPNFAVHARCSKYTKLLKHEAHPHKLNLVQYPAIGSSLDIQCNGCGKSIRQGYHYTCTDQNCDFDLHPVCAILPSGPLCRLNPTHRVEMDYQAALGSEQCALCNSQAKGADWMYRCGVCDAFMHIDCLNRESSDEEELSNDELDFSESDEEDEEIDELYGKFIESMDDFGNQDNEEQMDKLSELANSFKSHTEAASSLARQRSAKARVHPQISTRAPSEMHTVDHGFANMKLGGSSRPEVDRRSDAEDEERRRAKQAAKEQRQKEKAAARAVKDKKKAAQREDEAMRAEALAHQMRNFARELQKIQNHKQSGSTVDVLAKELADLKATMETGQASAANRHQEQVKLHQQQIKLHQQQNELHQQQHQQYMSRLHEIIRTQVHSTTRAVPRLVLCTETASKTRRLLTVLRLGLKGVQLHLMCEHAQQPHVVAGASGCEINQKVAGDRWTNLQPFLAAGVQIVAMAINFAGMGAGMSALGSVLPDFHQKVWDTQAIDLGKHTTLTSRNKLVPKKEAEAEEAAAEWLISYLNDRKIDIADNFKLYRVRYESPDHMKGAVGWLCQEHLDRGRKQCLLERFPVCK